MAGNLPLHMRRGNDPVSRIKKLESEVSSLKEDLSNLMEWAEQNGWDVATGFVKSDLSENPVKPSKGDKDASTKSDKK